MNIEFHLPQGEVHDCDVEFIGDTLIELHQRHTEINRVSVRFDKWEYAHHAEKICKICMFIYGTSFSVYSRAHDYKEASQKALAELRSTIEEWSEEYIH